MRFSDVWLLMRKDVMLMWRDKSIFIVVLLICLPFTQMLRTSLGDSVLGRPHAEYSSENSIVRAPWVGDEGDSETPSPPSSASSTSAAEVIHVGLIGGKAPPGLASSSVSLTPMTREKGLTSLRAGHVDLLAEFPENLISTEHLPPSIVRVNLIYDSPTWQRSRGAIEIFQNRLRSLELEHRRALVDRVRSSHADWVLCSVQYHTLNKFVDARLSSSSSLRVGALSGPLVLAGALIAALVMLVIVEENARHTLPLILVCAVDRRTVFLSKMALCMVPATGVVVSMMVRFCMMISHYHLPLLSSVLLTATAGGAGLLFVFIFCCILVAAGGRSRNNVEALAKVGAPTLLCGFIVAMAYSPLSQYTPGLILFPLTNTVFLLKELLTGHPNLLSSALCLISSSFFAILLARNGALAMRTEQGLSGDVVVHDPKLDSLLLFLLAASALTLLTNFIGIPASIVYPSVGSLSFVAILLVVGAGVFRLRPLSLSSFSSPSSSSLPSSSLSSSFLSSRFSLDSRSSRGRTVFSILCALVLALLTSFAFSLATPAGSLSSEVARIESVTRLAASPTLLFTFALLRSIVEELVLRGLLVSLLTPFFASPIIIGLMCSLGASIHPLADTWPLMLLLSAILTTVRIYSRSVIPCVVLHATHTICLWLLWHRVVQ